MYQFFIILIIVILGPIIGALLGILKKPSETYISNMLAFAAGVMIAISFFDLLPESIKYSSVMISATGIILGIAVMRLLEMLIPHVDHVSGHDESEKYKKSIFFLFLGILMHNFPEGMAIGISSVSTFQISIPVAFALAIHDIPETICTSAPYYFFTKKKLKSFFISISTAIPTIIGFFITYYVFKNISLPLLGILISANAGLMVYISIFELIPLALQKKEKNIIPALAFIGGMIMVVMLNLV